MLLFVPFMLRAVLLTLLLTCPAANAEQTQTCDWTFGIGKAYLLRESWTGQTAVVGCAWGKYEGRIFAVGNQYAYDHQLHTRPYLALTAQRVFTANRDGWLRPFLALGIMVKKPERCHDKKGFDYTCNRLVPQPLAFATSAGVWLGQMKLSLLNHWSNGSTSTPNTGQDFLMVEWRF